MRKYKCKPKKPGWYVAWFNGDTLDCPHYPLTFRYNLRYWNGEYWISSPGGAPTLFMDAKYKDDRWSYIPKK